MTFWIFKQSEQEQYPDEPGQTYVYDNRHSVRVKPGDSFVYLDKRGGGYGFAGHGTVTQVSTGTAEIAEQGRFRVSRVYTAKFHRAFDGGVFRLYETGGVSVAEGPDLDSVALAHVSSLSAEARLNLLNGINTELLRRRQSEES